MDGAFLVAFQFGNDKEREIAMDSPRIAI